MLTFHPQSALTPIAEQGTTLIELLVAMLSAMVVLGALLAILEFSTGQETRISDKVQADRIGRAAMARVVDELHSSCTGFGATAIQAPTSTPKSPLLSSGPADLWFLSAYGNASSGSAVLTGVIEHDIHWGSTGKLSNTGQTLGTLTDYRFPSQSGRSPEWKFKELTVANAEARVLAQNVIPQSISGTSTIFQYYRFSSPSSAEVTQLASGELPLTTTTAPTVAKVLVGFTQAPETGDTRVGLTVPFQDAVVLRFTPTETGAEAKNEPCT
jgi:Tfp pilus assembly protein PilW